jgi:hypothetical protein
MNPRTKAILLGSGIAVATAAVAIVVLTGGLLKAMDPQHYCDTGFSRWSTCRYHANSKTISQSTPIFATPPDAASPVRSGSRETPRLISVEVTSWAIADCPGNYIARRLLCAVAADAPRIEVDDNDPVTGLPRPKPWLLTTAKDSLFIKAFHVETPLDLAGVLRFYRVTLGQRGWSERDGAVVEPGHAAIAFTTADGPALLRLTRQGDRTIADLSLRKPAVTDAAIPPMPKALPGQARLLLGNDTDEEAVITINAQTMELPAHAELTDGRKSSESCEIDLPPGKYKVSLKIASAAAQNREFEVAADETWGLMVGPAGVPLPLHLY